MGGISSHVRLPRMRFCCAFDKETTDFFETTLPSAGVETSVHRLTTRFPQTMLETVHLKTTAGGQLL